MKRSKSARAIVRLAARAKVNLRLNVLAREASGYHQIETLFCALDVADEVEITLSGDALRLDTESPDDIEVPAGAENIVYRAAQKFFHAAAREPGAVIRLKKRIPVGAGLGGGSSDAASALKGLNLLCGHPLTDERLIEIAASLGSDVPFFLCGSSLAFAWGRGHRLMPIAPLPEKPVLLVVPPFGIETKSAYDALSVSNESVGLRATVLRPDAFATWESTLEGAANDFEPVLFPRYPLLAQIKGVLLEADADHAMLSGSGSVVFALFSSERLAARAAKRTRDRFPDARTIETHTVTWTGKSGA